MSRDDRRNPADERIHRADERQDECKGTEYIHSDPAYPPESPGALHAAPLHPTTFGGFGRGATLATRRCFILGSAFRLHHFGHESSLRTGPALHEGLGFIYKSIRQGVSANVTNRKRLPFPLQHKINAASEMTDTSGCGGPADAHALAFRGAAQG